MTSSVYESMWENFCAALAQGRYEQDTMIGNPADDRRGIAVVASLQKNSLACSQSVKTFLDEVRALEPEQYYHPQEELHLTVLSIISCAAGFRLQDISVPAYTAIFHQALQHTEPLEIVFRGITASPGCVVIQGFPTGPGLENLRNRLRQLFRASGLLTTMDSRYRLTTAHISAIRFRTTIRHPGKFFGLLEDYRDYCFGSVCLTDFELLFNNWYQNLSVTRLLADHTVGTIKL